MALNLFSPILKLFGQGGLSNPDKGAQWDGPTIISTDAGITVTDEKALQISAFWGCVQIIVDSISSLPLDWFDQSKSKKGVRTPIDPDDPIVSLFLGSPNEYMKTRDFRRCLTAQLAIYNNAYAKIDWKNGIPFTEPVAITPLKSPQMLPHIDDGIGLTYHYATQDGPVVFAKENIMHLKGMSMEGITGWSRASFSRNTLGISASANLYASKQFANGGTPGGVLKCDKIFTKQQRAVLKDLYENISMTATNANKLWVLEGGLNYESIMKDPNTMQMLESRQFQISEIARFFGVPDILIGGGDKNSAWPASYEQQLLSFLTFTMQSYIDEWEQTLIYSLVPRGKRRYMRPEHDVEGFIRMDSSAKANYLSKMVVSGLMTRNEGRDKIRLPRSEQPGADDLTVQSNLWLLDALEKIGNVDTTKT